MRSDRRLDRERRTYTLEAGSESDVVRLPTSLRTEDIRSGRGTGEQTQWGQYQPGSEGRYNVLPSPGSRERVRWCKIILIDVGKEGIPLA